MYTIASNTLSIVDKKNDGISSFSHVKQQNLHEWSNVELLEKNIYLFISLFVKYMILVRHGMRPQTYNKTGLPLGYSLKVLLFVGLWVWLLVLLALAKQASFRVVGTS